MARGMFRRFLRNQSGAVAATYAIALPALIVVAGVGFDYGRMVAMDSELQNAADQAALAAVTQLDGEAGAREEAVEAARDWLVNSTLMSDTQGKITVSAENVIFWQDREKVALADSDANARFVEVRVDPRGLTYMLTPLGGAVGPDLAAQAMAGMGSSVCKVPPLFLCNPLEAGGNIGADFPTSTLIGAGMRAIAGSADVPGNFGFLDTNAGDNSTGSLAKALGWTNIPADCSPVSEGIGLKPGQRDVVFNAFNTRFDITENGQLPCPSGGSCPAALNTRKDLVRRATGNPGCATGNSGWQEAEVPYRPTSATEPLALPAYPDFMGHPRDMCHAVSFDGLCTYNGQTPSVVGNAVWDRNAYFRVNFGYTSAAAWQSATGLGPNATRFEVYDWELKDAANRLAVKTVGGNGANGRRANSQPICRAPAGADDIDRRKIALAIVNCQDQAGKISGNDAVEVLKYVEMFLVEPAFRRRSGSSNLTTDDQIYVEVIRELEIGDGEEDAQVIRRDVPYLVR
ncbi:MAG: pilus assembly protein [Novosphingobium sp.]|nr:pilus assembly protein [Novosphingobium sp.]